MRRAVGAAAVVAVVALAFVAGRVSAPSELAWRLPQPSEGAERDRPPQRPGEPETPPAVSGPTTTLARVISPPCPAVAPTAAGTDSTAAAPLADCPRQLAALQAQARLEAEQRVANEGTPLPSPPSELDPRFSQEQLRGALSQAFTQARVPGGLKGIDCSEYPCLLYGRIRGSEDFMERLEQTRALAAYEEDLMVALLWTVTDEAERPRAAAAGLPAERVEQTLFAVSLFPRSDRQRWGEVLDRRLRARTFALWNTMSPFDETGR